MPLYRFNEAELNLPADWKDTTINAFVLPGEEGGGAASFVITRDLDAPQTELRDYSDQQLVRAAQQLASYELVSRANSLVDGQPAIQSDYTWLTPERISVKQLQTFVRHNDVFLVITLTARTASFATYEPVWAEVLNSVRLRPGSLR